MMIHTADGVRRGEGRILTAAAALCLILAGAGQTAAAGSLREWLDNPAEHLDELRAQIPELTKQGESATDPVQKLRWTLDVGRVQAALGEFDAALKTVSEAAKAAGPDLGQDRTSAYWTWFRIARRTGKPSTVKTVCEAMIKTFKDSSEQQGKNLVSAADRQLKYLDRLGQSMKELGGKTIQGPPFRFSDKKGKIVFVHFWGTW